MEELIKKILKEETNNLKETYWQTSDDDKWNSLEKAILMVTNTLLWVL